MKHISPLIAAFVAAIFLSSTGFQCSSAESTSAKLYINQKQYDKAEEALMKEVAKNPADEEGWFLLGQARVELKKYVEANQAYDKALALSDVHRTQIFTNKTAFWGKMLNEGIECFKRGATTPASYDTAISKFETALVFQPDSAYTYFAMSLAQSATNQDEKAKASLETALQKKPTFAEATQRLGKLYRSSADDKKGKDEAGRKADLMKAAQLFETAHNANPEQVDHRLGMDERVGHYPAAVQ